MDFVWGIIPLAVIAIALWKSDSQSQQNGNSNEEKVNYYDPNVYPSGSEISEQEFRSIVYATAKKIKRIKRTTIVGARVICLVDAQSNISRWEFELDFRHRNTITGRYTIETENDDSAIPESLGDRIQEKIEEYLENVEADKVRARSEAYYQKIIYGSDTNDSEQVHDEPEATSKEMPNEVLVSNSVDSDMDSSNQVEQEKESYSEPEINNREYINKAESNHNHSGIVISILCCIILGLVFWIAYDKVISPHNKVTIGMAAESFIDLSRVEANEIIRSKGFNKIEEIDLGNLSASDDEKIGKIGRVSINGRDAFQSDTVFPLNSEVKLFYQSVRKIRFPFEKSDIKEIGYKSLEERLRELGFANVTVVGNKKLVTGWLKKENDIESLTINGHNFSYGESYPVDAEVVITIYTFKK
jgi:hypothetical protein